MTSPASRELAQDGDHRRDTLHQVVELLEMGDNALQCTITSVSIRLAAMEARDRPSRGVGVIDDWGDNDSQCAFAIREGPKLGNDQPLDLVLRFWQFYHNMAYDWFSCHISSSRLCRNRARTSATGARLLWIYDHT